MEDKKIAMVNTPIAPGYVFETAFEKMERYQAAVSDAVTEPKQKKKVDQRFSKKQQQQIYALENGIRLRLTQDISSYVAGSIFDLTEDIHETSTNPMFIKLNKNWRDYVRTRLIPVYPLAKTHKDVRENLFNLFANKLYEALENIKKKNE